MCHLLRVCLSVRDEGLDSGHQLVQHDAVVDRVGVPGDTRHTTSGHSSDTDTDTTGEFSYTSVYFLRTPQDT